MTNKLSPRPSKSTSIPLSDRLKVIGAVALAGCIGVGGLWLGQSWQNNQMDDSFEPIADSGEREQNQQNQQRPLRDRVRVINLDSPSRLSKGGPERKTKDSINLKAPLTKGDLGESKSRGFEQANQTVAIVLPVLPRDDTIVMPSESVPAQSSEAKSSEKNAIVMKGNAAATLKSGSSAKPSKGESDEQPLTTKPIPLIALLLEAPPLQLSAPILPGNIANQSPPQKTENPFNIPIPEPIPEPTPKSISQAISQISKPIPPNPQLNTPQPIIPPTSEPKLIIPEPITPGIPKTLVPSAIALLTRLKDNIEIDQLKITGNTRFSQTELATNLQKDNPVLAMNPTAPKRPVTPAELVQASEAITKFYTDRGYINSGAYVPADVLNGGTPEIRIVEGSLEAIKVTVEPPGFLGLGQRLGPNYVRGRLANAIRTPLNIDQLVDIVKLLEQDPLIEQVSTKLEPGTAIGKSVLNVNVKQAQPFRFTATVDNSRSPSVGRLRQQVSVSQANLLGLGDRLQVGFNRSQGSQGFDIGYTLPINTNNGTLSFLYNNNRGRVIEQPFQDLDIKSESQSYEIAYRQPLFRSSTQEFALSFRGTHYRNAGVFLETLNDGVAIPFPARGSNDDGVTQVTALRFGQEWVKRGPSDVFSLQSELSLGLYALGSTRLAEPPDSSFVSWQGRGLWVHSFAPDTLLSLKGQLQFADRPLVPVEQMSLGGLDTVRGYRSGVLLADSAWFTSAELYLPILRNPKWRSIVQVVPFFDMGHGWNRGGEQPQPSTIASLGLGLQWKLGESFRTRLDWGFPLINSTAGNGQSLREGLFFSVQYSP